jgi:iron complex outermembrane receptor protein
MNSFYVYEQMYDEQGKPIEGQYVDRNKDGQVNSSDLYTYQKPAADVLMGFNTNLSYKNWNFGMSARISLGNYVYNNVASNSTYAGLYSPMNYLSNITRQANDTKFASQQYYSDYYVENGSFLKIDNVNLGYTFTDIASKGLSLNLNLAVQNVLLITGYKGLDPEINGGMDNNFYPRTRAFMLGVSLTF